MRTIAEVAPEGGYRVIAYLTPPLPPASRDLTCSFLSGSAGVASSGAVAVSIAFMIVGVRVNFIDTVCEILLFGVVIGIYIVAVDGVGVIIAVSLVLITNVLVLLWSFSWFLAEGMLFLLMRLVHFLNFLLLLWLLFLLLLLPILRLEWELFLL